MVINAGNLGLLTMLKLSISLKEICSRRRRRVILVMLWESSTALQRVRKRRVPNEEPGSAILIGHSFTLISLFP